MTELRPLADRLLEGGWLAIAAMVPIVINPWGESIFGLPKAAVLRTLVCGMLGVWFAAEVLNRRPNDRNLNRSPLMLPVVVLLIVIVAATVLAEDPLLSLWGSHERAQGALTLLCLPVLALLVAIRLPGAAGAVRLFWVMSATTLPLAVYAGLQLVGPDPLGLVTDARSGVFATLGRSNFLGAYLAMLVPLALSLRSLALHPFIKALATSLLALEGALLLATQTRASVLAATVAIACWAALYFRRNLLGLRRRTPALVAVWGLLAVLMASALGLAQAGGSGAARLAIWQGTQRLIAARPLLGYGPDSLGLVFPRVYPPELVYYQGRGLDVDRAHNLILDWGVMLGIVGLFVGAAVCFVVVKSGWRFLARTVDDPTSLNRQREILMIGALAALVGNLAGNLVGFDCLPTLTCSWLLAGTVVALATQSDVLADSSETTDPSGGVSFHAGSTFQSMAPALIGLIVVVAAGVLNLRPLAADILEHRANELASEGRWSEAIAVGTQAVRAFPADPGHRQILGWIRLQSALVGGSNTQEDLGAAEQLLEEALAQRPGSFRLAKTLAEFHSTAALRFDRRHLRSAEDAWKRATELAPNHGFLYRAWGRLRLQAGNQDAAGPLLSKAVDLDTTDAEAWLLLAGLEFERQRPASALIMYRQAAMHAPERSEPLLGVARAYWLLGQPEVAWRTVTEVLELAPQNAAALALAEEFSASSGSPPGAPD